jgi:hypothetical protein
MSLALRALLLICLMSVVSVCAQAQTRMLALFAESPRGLDADSTLTMRAELQRLLDPAGIEVVWKDPASHRAGDDFDLIAIASFEGSCLAAGPVLIPVSTAVDTVPSLAATSVSDGHISPFFHVDCPRLVRMLGFGAGQTLMGRALARVIAHEVFHIVAGTADHHTAGVAKASLSVHDLTDPRFDFDLFSLAQMKTLPVSQIE